MRFVGDTVAVVVAETRAAAIDAAEAVVVEYDPLPAVVDPEAALAPDAPLQFEELGSNVAAAIAPRGERRRARGCRRRRARPHREPAHRRHADGGRARSRSSPATTAPATTSPSTSRRRCRTASRIGSRRCSSSTPAQLRVVAPHVGGAFGGKPGLAAEHCVAVAAALRLQTAGEVGRDALGEPRLDAARPRPGAVRASSGASATARSSACGAGSSATRARTRASAARSRWVRRA